MGQALSVLCKDNQTKILVMVGADISESLIFPAPVLLLV